jgi:ATP-dependent HslUV protease ATP-binding subunit HslU
MERLLEEISFSAIQHENTTLTIDRAYVDSQLNTLVKDEDLSRFIL